MACAALVVLTASCSHDVEVDAPSVSGSAARSCAALVKALPSAVSDQKVRRVDGRGYAAAWGDPPIELRCGVRRPAAMDRFASCQVVNGVGWFLPESQSSDAPVTLTTMDRAVFVQVRIPQKYFPPATTMVDLGPAVRRTLPRNRRCG